MESRTYPFHKTEVKEKTLEHCTNLTSTHTTQYTTGSSLYTGTFLHFAIKCANETVT